jgi:plastocyanin
MSPRSCRPTLVLAVGASLAAVLLVGCSSSSGVADGPPADLGEVVDLRAQGDVSVVMADNIYTPRAMRVAPGAHVTFRNDGANVHNATPNQDGSFATVEVSPSGSGTVTVPTAPGTYRFYCSLHASADSGLQRGALVVE